MQDAVTHHYDAFPEPSPALVPVDAAQLDRIDDGLHFGWSWHRHHYAFRRWEHLRILDAGCGTGLTTLGLARLNPGSEVLGVDASPRSLELAQARLAVAHVPRVDFFQHDLAQPLPAGRNGPFDFVVCRGVLAVADDPARLLGQLARVLDGRGLLLLTLPARLGQLPARQFREAIDALSPPDADLATRAELGLDLLRSLRPDHPIRQYEARFSGAGNLPSVERMAAAYLGPAGRDWNLPEAIALIESAGLRFLYAASGRPWQPARVFASEQVPEGLRLRVGALAERDRSILMAALDPTMYLDEYRIYCGPADFEPRLPGWPERLASDPAAIDALIPHVTGLAAPEDPAPPSAGQPILYRVITGALGPVNPLTDRLFRAVDGRRTCGEIARDLPEPTTAEARRALWLDLANHGFVALESPDPRQHVDCVHLGPIRDRLDCACPRRWIRACERYEFCTIDEVQPDDPAAPALRGALSRLGIGRVQVCARCPDYDPET